MAEPISARANCTSYFDQSARLALIREVGDDGGKHEVIKTGLCRRGRNRDGLRAPGRYVCTIVEVR